MMRWIGLLAVAAVLALAGCGGSDDNGGSGGSGASGGSSDDSASSDPSPSGSGGGGKQLALAADAGGAIKFDKTSLTTKSGKVTVNFTNDSSVPHAVEIEGNGVEEETKTVTGGKASVTVDLKPGKYEFYCPVSDHKDEGMKGTLTVN